MKFARMVFFAAGAWGIVVLTPLYFLFDPIGRQYSSPITYPQFFFSVASCSGAAFAADPGVRGSHVNVLKAS